MRKRHNKRQKRRRATRARVAAWGKAFVSLLLVVTLSTMGYSPATAVAGDTSDSGDDAAQAVAATEQASLPGASADEATGEAEPAESTPDQGGASDDQSAPSAASSASDSAESGSSASASGASTASATSESAATTSTRLKGTLNTARNTHYTIVVDYGDSAGIPEGATLDITEWVQEPIDPNWRQDPAYAGRPCSTERFVSKDYLAERTAVACKGLDSTGEAYAYSSKFLKVSVVSDGREVTPKAPVTVTIETNDVELAYADGIELANMVYDKAVASNRKLVQDGFVASDGKTARAVNAENLTDAPDSETGRRPSDSGLAKFRYTSDKLGELALVGIAMPKHTVWQDDTREIQVLGPRALGVYPREASSAGISEDEEPLGAYVYSTSSVRHHLTTLYARVKTAKGAAQGSGKDQVHGFVLQSDGIVGNEVAMESEGENPVLAFRAEDGVAFALAAGKTEEQAPDTAKQPAAKSGKAGVLTQGVTAFDGTAYTVTLSYGAEAALPEDVVLQVRELAPSEREWYRERTAQALGADSLTYMRAFDITIRSADGAVLEPAAPVHVTMRLADVPLLGDTNVVHFAEGAPVVITPNEGFAPVGAPIDFTTDSFSVYVVANAVLSKTLVASDGNEYVITATYDNASGIPDDAQLQVVEIREDDAGYDDYLAQTADALQGRSLDYARLFDISIVDASGTRYQPNGSVAVAVKLAGTDMSSQDVNVVHFGDTVQQVEATADGSVVRFSANGFSVYSIVVSSSLPRTSSVGAIEEDVPYHFSVTRDAATATDYMTTEEKTGGTEGLGKTTSLKDAGVFYLESASEGKYYVYTFKDSQKRYFTFADAGNGAHLRLSDAAVESSCAVSVTPVSKTVNGVAYTFYTIKWNNKNINQFNQFAGDRFALWLDANNTDQGGHLLITKADASTKDPLGIDGSMCIIVCNGNTAMVAASNGTGLGKVSVTKNDDGTYSDTDAAPATPWMFTANDDGTYYISTVVDNATKYLSVASGSLAVLDVPHAFTIDNIYQNGLVLFGQDNRVRMRYSNNRFEGFYSSNAPGNDQLFTLGKLSSYVSYEMVVQVPDGEQGESRPVTISKSGASYVEGMTAAAPPHSSYAYFTNEETKQGWLFDFQYWAEADDPSHIYNIGDDIKAKYMEYHDLEDLPETWMLSLVSVYSLRNTELSAIYTVVNHLDNTSTYVIGGDSYTFDSAIADLSNQDLALVGSESGNSYTSTTTAASIAGYVDLYNGAFSEETEASEGQVAISIAHVSRDYEFFPTYDQAMQDESGRGAQHFLVAIDNAWVELERSYYMDYYAAAGNRLAWQNAYLHAMYEGFYNAEYIQREASNSQYRDYEFGNSVNDRSKAYIRKSTDGFTPVFLSNNTTAPKYVFYTPYIPPSASLNNGDVILSLMSNNVATDNTKNMSFYTITLSDELQEQYEESELLGGASLVTGIDDSWGTPLRKLSEGDFADGYKDKVQLHNCYAFNNRKVTVKVKAPGRYADTDLSASADTEPRLMLVSADARMSETIRIAPTARDASTNTYTFTISADQMTCPYEAKIITRDPLGVDGKSRMIVNVSESLSVAMNANVPTANRLGSDIVTPQNDRYDTGANTLPTMWKFEVAGDGNGMYTISQGDKYLNMATGNGNGNKNLTLGTKPQVFYAKAQQDGRISIRATEGPGAYLHYLGSQYNLAGYYSNQANQPDSSELFYLGLPAYDIYYTYPAADPLYEADQDTANNRPVGYQGAAWQAEYVAAQPKQDPYTSAAGGKSWVYDFTKWKTRGSDTTYDVGDPIPDPDGLLVLEAQWQYNPDKSVDAQVVQYLIEPADTASIKQDYPLPTVMSSHDYSEFVETEIRQQNYALKPLDGDRPYYKTYTGLNENQKTYAFAGWQDETGAVHAAEEVLDLTATNDEGTLALDVDGDGVITMQAAWNDKYKNGSLRRVFFYIDKSAVSSQANSDASFVISTNANDFTYPAFCSLMEYSTDNAPLTYTAATGNNTYPIVYYHDTVANDQGAYGRVFPHIGEYTEEKGYGIVTNISDANAAVRRLSEDVTVVDPAFNRTQTFKLLEFPTDEQVLSFLRDNYSPNVGNKQNVTLDGEPVDPDTLTTKYYTIKWYVCKYQGDWHIDGKLTPKASYLTVKKTFSGDESALQKIEQQNPTADLQDHFYIEAKNVNENTSYGQRNQFQLVLAPEETIDELLDTSNPYYYDSGPRGYTSYDPATHTYTWSMRVRANSEYAITENNYDVRLDNGIDYGVMAQWNMTYAGDEHSTTYRQWISDLDSFSQLVDVDYLKQDITLEERSSLNLYNNYVEKGTFAIHAVGQTPNGTTTPDERNLPGTYYRVYDSEMNSVGVTQTASGRYTVDLRENQGAQVNEVHTDGQGRLYLKMPVSATETRSFIITETVPAGYLGYGEAEQPKFTVRVNADGMFEVSDITAPKGGSITPVTVGVGADTGVITGVVVKNAAEKVSVRADKVWDCPIPKQASTVTMQLKGTISSGARRVYTAQAVLSAGNNWTYIWDNLPRYYNANPGDEISYTVEEIKIGDKGKGSTAFQEWGIAYERAAEAAGEGDSAAGEDASRQIHWIVTNSYDGVIHVDLNKVSSDGSADVLDGYRFEYFEAVRAGDQTPGAATEVISFDGTPVSVYARARVVSSRSEKMSLDLDRTYYLREDQPPSYYLKKNGYIKIDVSADGRVVVTPESESDWQAGDVEYTAGNTIFLGTLTLKNDPARFANVVLRKVSASDGFEAQSGAVFNVCRSMNPDVSVRVNGELLEGLRAQDNGTLWVGALPYGTYYLHETQPSDRAFILTVDDEVTCARLW